MILHNVTLLNGDVRSIRIVEGKIHGIYIPGKVILEGNAEVQLFFDNCLAVPGLINSHDHLDFNLYPQLGNHTYTNYMEWGADIHKKNAAVIGDVLHVPQLLRAKWGMFKNLLNGVTTVVQHGEDFSLEDAPIDVYSNCYSLHSVGLEKSWKYILNKPFAKKWPFVIHIGEGTDKAREAEIDKLLRWNLWGRKLVGIHGVAMRTDQARHFEALIWCPASNFFLLGKTTAIDKLKKETAILFGTDSTVSAPWSIWEQLREARSTGLLSDTELIEAVTSKPANVWGLNSKGTLQEGYSADIVVMEKKAAATTDTFFENTNENILLVTKQGNIVYFDASLLQQLKGIPLEKYSKVFVNGRCKYIIGTFASLVKEIKQYYPEAYLPVEVE